MDDLESGSVPMTYLNFILGRFDTGLA
jgi:hypothetical protein